MKEWKRTLVLGTIGIGFIALMITDIRGAIGIITIAALPVMFQEVFNL